MPIKPSPAARLVHPARLAREAVGLTRAQLAPYGLLRESTLRSVERRGTDEVTARRLTSRLQAVADKRGLGLTIPMDIYLPDYTRPQGKSAKASK